jgi:peroxiredoxin
MAGRYLLAALLILCACLAGCSRNARYPIEVGAAAPGFSLESLAGGRISLNELQQRGMVLVNFWATWCSLCKAEVPLLNKIQQDFKTKGLTVVGVSVEDRKDMVSAFRRRHDIQYSILLDPSGDVAKRYGLFALPMTVLVDRNGKVVLRKYGVIDEQVTATLAGELHATR